MPINLIHWTFLLNAIYSDLSFLLFEYILGEKETLMQARGFWSDHFLYSLSFVKVFFFKYISFSWWIYFLDHSIQGYFKT